MKLECKTCYYFCSDNQKECGLCLRHAPHLYFIENRPKTHWPSVQGSNGCGDHLLFIEDQK